MPHDVSRGSGGAVRSGRIPASRAGAGAAGIGLLVGGGVAYLVERASSEALATTSRVMVTTGLAGLVLMAVVVAVRLLVHRYGPGGRPPGDRIFLVPDAGRLRPVPVRVTTMPPHEQRRSA